MTQRIALGKFAGILRGTTPSHIDETGRGPIFVGQTEVTGGVGAPTRHVELTDGEGTSPVFLTPGDIVMGSLDQKHRALLIDDSRRGAVLGRDCLAVRIDGGNWTPMSPQFIAVWTKTEDFQHQAVALATGTVMPRLTHKGLALVEVPILEPARQAQIVKLARQFEDATSSVRATLQELEQLEAIEIELAFLEGDGGE